MKILIKILIIIFFTTSFANAEKLRIGSDGDFRPFVYLGQNPLTWTGGYVGAEMDLAYFLCERMEVECEIIIENFDLMIPALKNGQIDIILSAMTITDERQKQIDFSIPYFSFPDGTGAGVGIRKNDNDLKSKINKAISDFIIEGIIKEISMNYWQEDFTP